MSLVREGSADLRRILGPGPLAVSELRVGVYFTAAQLFTGHLGVAFTPRTLVDTVCCPKTAAAAPNAGYLAGQDAWELAEYAV